MLHTHQLRDEVKSQKSFGLSGTCCKKGKKKLFLMAPITFKTYLSHILSPLLSTSPCSLFIGPPMFDSVPCPSYFFLPPSLRVSLPSSFLPSSIVARMGKRKERVRAISPPSPGAREGGRARKKEEGKLQHERANNRRRLLSRKDERGSSPPHPTSTPYYGGEGGGDSSRQPASTLHGRKGAPIPLGILLLHPPPPSEGGKGREGRHTDWLLSQLPLSSLPSLLPPLSGIKLPDRPSSLPP